MPVPGLSPFVGLLVGFLLFVVIFLKKHGTRGGRQRMRGKGYVFQKKKPEKNGSLKRF